VPIATSALNSTGPAAFASRQPDRQSGEALRNATPWRQWAADYLQPAVAFVIVPVLRFALIND